ncbi:TetR/AcrR family transcriptional regulator [Nonomuraea sp. NBC_01738]|uniref:TetR/AcrR family transcriptional regulator n=1 Tax=Nonomuraea sp. NBC_01738 TaxID=2976003 RepID=UPI002E0DDBDC|nr:TetR/AcrR family transcriptional regulator [Nonomuraea sp. NBC_01738]
MREDTRTRIQEIALRLFTEQGYEATSLREIAEELGVTKAALYYHFKTKDDIVGSLVEQRMNELESLLTWLHEQPKTAETRRELVLRYAETLDKPRHAEMARFLERNQTALRDHSGLLRMRQKMLDVSTALTGPDEPLATRIRRSLGLFSLHAGMWLTQDTEVSEEDRRKATIEVALELMEP